MKVQSTKIPHLVLFQWKTYWQWTIFVSETTNFNLIFFLSLCDKVCQ